MRINEVTYGIIGAAYAVHRQIGPGLLESAYEACLAMQFHEDGLEFLRQHPLPLMYHGRDVGCGYRADLLVEGLVIVEVKSVARLEPVHVAQSITYLKLSGCRVALLMNFNVTNMQNGIRRVILGYDRATPPPNPRRRT